ncbi:MAG: Gfo/Idh/MocA family oxidoreductase [Lentisphaeria bacterium]
MNYSVTEKIKVGVIGYGGAFNMGRSHLKEMQKAGMTPAAACDLDIERLKIAEEEFPGIKTFTSVDAMLTEADVDMITIITPHNTHAELALKCLESGRHVVCEKPLAVTTEECDQMIAAAKKNDLVLSTYHNRHWDGCILRAREQIENGIIGDVVRIEAHMGQYGNPGDWWRTSKKISGGILYDWGVHLLEYALQLLPKSNMTEVSSYCKQGVWADQTKWKDDTNEDEAQAVVRFDTGQWLSLNITQLDANPKEGQLEITGTRGSYLFSGGWWKTITIEDGVKVTREGRNPKSEGWRFYQNIADHLVKGTELMITPEWARRPIHVLDLAGESAREGISYRTKYN